MEQDSSSKSCSNDGCSNMKAASCVIHMCVSCCVRNGCVKDAHICTYYKKSKLYSKNANLNIDTQNPQRKTAVKSKAPQGSKNIVRPVFGEVQFINATVERNNQHYLPTGTTLTWVPEYGNNINNSTTNPMARINPPSKIAHFTQNQRLDNQQPKDSLTQTSVYNIGTQNVNPITRSFSQQVEDQSSQQIIRNGESVISERIDSSRPSSQYSLSNPPYTTIMGQGCSSDITQLIAIPCQSFDNITTSKRIVNNSRSNTLKQFNTGMTRQGENSITQLYSQPTRNQFSSQLLLGQVSP
ncbi:hypothetical protein C9374_009007 [Naegleria lovaniensis]|uniref:Uncharacterized protein n=1 Tax=Naegleria lovaniensis TaxID=51637 RepID=A0AA88KF04_NAELO|nr:uncharacterized protein C9374_009007 [Naegleria lovaniensis]KAG2377922.1 hypothetical protein C9374_009007 [Naegleria lovaniensis]